MVMSLSECNLARITNTQLEACLQDCKTNFYSDFTQHIAPLDSQSAKTAAHMKCNSWRKSAETIEAATEPSNLLLITTVTVIVLLAAAKLYGSQQKAATTKPSTAPKPSTQANILSIFNIKA
ncbi:MAG: hypothetical protein K2Y01_06080 [Rhabdochlamydiaceae bacterium]|nr:hypothetical protein [Rhabdochlamydiaceae bacterium]